MMIDYKDILRELPEMKSGTELAYEMAVLPEYDNSIRNENQTVRLMGLSDLYRIYVPTAASFEIYSKLYLAMIRSLQKKCTNTVIKQYYENHKAMSGQQYNGIMGGSDSFTIIGCSGIGKSSAISRAINLITENRIIEVKKPDTTIIPCVVVQCPFDSSVKGLLLEILRKIDEMLETTYYQSAMKSRQTTTDMLIGLVSTLSINHIGLLIVDEIQNVVNSKNGKNLVGMLTQLINNSGISICMVGTPESKIFFEQKMQLARRSLGLCYDAMEYNQEFVGICKTLYSYQYVKNTSQIDDSIITWLYEHSGGIISVVVSLIHDAQEIAILNGKETLDLEALNEAYKQRLSMLHDYIQSNITRKPQTTQAKKKVTAIAESKKKQPDTTDIPNIKICEIVAEAKAENKDIVELLQKYISLEVVTV